jgi:ABC-2 type transport system ATP-binding protein
MAYIEVEGVSKSYKSQKVIHNVNISFEQGKSYGIMGYNGSGKSVFLKLLTGYAFADEGEIRIQGKVLKKDMDFIPEAGIVINAPEFIKSMSGLDNLRFLAEVRKKIGEEQIEEVLKKFGLYEARKKKVGAYSLGMKQRLRLAQALMESPQILILDEPFNALDKEGIALVKDILREFVSSGHTLIFTSHSKEDVMDLADEVYEVEAGEIRRAEGV